MGCSGWMGDSAISRRLRPEGGRRISLSILLSVRVGRSMEGSTWIDCLSFDGVSNGLTMLAWRNLPGDSSAAPVGRYLSSSINIISPTTSLKSSLRSLGLLSSYMRVKISYETALPVFSNSSLSVRFALSWDSTRRDKLTALLLSSISYLSLILGNYRLALGLRYG